MPPLVCPSPDVIDQTFPRSNAEMILVRAALSNLTQLIAKDQCVILLTQVLSTFIVELQNTFSWEKMESFPDLQIIYRVLAEFGLQQHGVQRIDVSTMDSYQLHPVPKGLECRDFAHNWSDELGRLFVLHSRFSKPGSYFVGVACTLAFGGQAKGSYDNTTSAPAFPLIAPEDISLLEDSSQWEIPHDIHRRSVTFDDAYKRIALLGGRVSKPKGSSHYQVRFAHAPRPWPLDYNISPIPDRFLKQLEPISGQSIEVIKYVLTEGKWPRRILKIPPQFT